MALDVEKFESDIGRRRRAHAHEPTGMLERLASMFPFDAYTKHAAREAEATPAASSEVPDYVYEVFTSVLDQGLPTSSTAPTPASGLSPRTLETRLEEATGGFGWTCHGQVPPHLLCGDEKFEGAEE
jgi:hypothetical protein